MLDAEAWPLSETTFCCILHSGPRSTQIWSTSRYTEDRRKNGKHGGGDGGKWRKDEGKRGAQGRGKWEQNGKIRRKRGQMRKNWGKGGQTGEKQGTTGGGNGGKCGRVGLGAAPRVQYGFVPGVSQHCSLLLDIPKPVCFVPSMHVPYGLPSPDLVLKKTRHQPLSIFSRPAAVESAALVCSRF